MPSAMWRYRSPHIRAVYLWVCCRAVCALFGRDIYVVCLRVSTRTVHAHNTPTTPPKSARVLLESRGAHSRAADAYGGTPESVGRRRLDTKHGLPMRSVQTIFEDFSWHDSISGGIRKRWGLAYGGMARQHQRSAQRDGAWHMEALESIG
jgi:hypothetical protein